MTSSTCVLSVTSQVCAVARPPLGCRSHTAAVARLAPGCRSHTAAVARLGSRSHTAARPAPGSLSHTVVRPPLGSPLEPHENVIVGNTVLYGATGGRLFAAGDAGERFCVRNSGAQVVVEGAGSNACEYMTGGVAVILGGVGDNFGAGMTGGMAYVWDDAGDFEARCNMETLVVQRLASSHWEADVRGLIEEHARVTESPLATRLLREWHAVRREIWQVCPKEMVDRISHPLSDEAEAATA